MQLCIIKLIIMKAVILKEAGPAENLIVTELPKPAIKPNEVLIRTKAFGINPVDIKTRKGKSLYNELKKESDDIILGWDVSGIIEEVGSDVKDLKAGDEVFGMVNFPGNGKAYAEYVAAPASQLALKPANISHEEAAAATLAALTAWQALVTHGKLQRGEKVLIHAAAGGVGHYAVQIAKHLGAYVAGTSSAANKDFVLSLGANAHIDYKTQQPKDVVSDIDLVIDAIGSNDVEPSLSVLKRDGRLITLPSISSETVIAKAKEKGVHAFFFMVHSNGDDMKQLAALLEKGVIKSHVSQTFTINEIAEAHKQVETGKTRGKVAVTFS